jgi:hypothetical protein
LGDRLPGPLADRRLGVCRCGVVVGATQKAVQRLLIGLAEPGDEGPVASKASLKIRSGLRSGRGGSAGVVGRDGDTFTAGC